MFARFGRTAALYAGSLLIASASELLPHLRFAGWAFDLTITRQGPKENYPWQEDLFIINAPEKLRPKAALGTC
jgi:hypothetical protein